MQLKYKYIASAIGILGSIILIYSEYKRFTKEIQPEIKYVKEYYNFRSRRKEVLIELNGKQIWVYNIGIRWYFVETNRQCNPTIALLIAQLTRKNKTN